MLAYVFWHWPRPEIGRETYESRLRAFQDVLRREGPAELKGAYVWRISGASWLPGGEGYADWYLLDGSAGLDVLNEAAVSGPIKPAHDAAAPSAAGGRAGLYTAISADVESLTAHRAAWFAKPEGMPYAEFYRQAGGGLWRRMMVLSAAPEMCVLGRNDIPREWKPEIVRREPVWLPG